MCEGFSEISLPKIWSRRSGGKSRVPQPLLSWRWRFSSMNHYRWQDLGLLLDSQYERGLNDVENCRKTNIIEVQRISIHWKNHCHSFLGPVWSPVTQIYSTKDDCHSSFIFRYLCQVANGHEGEASRSLSRGVILHHNNASSHSVGLTQTGVKKYEV